MSKIAPNTMEKELQIAKRSMNVVGFTHTVTFYKEFSMPAHALNYGIALIIADDSKSKVYKDLKIMRIETFIKELEERIVEKNKNMV